MSSVFMKVDFLGANVARLAPTPVCTLMRHMGVTVVDSGSLPYVHAINIWQLYIKTPPGSLWLSVRRGSP